jgi:hypothetical protein
MKTIKSEENFMRPSTLQIGVARIDITPEEGTQLAGNIGHRRPMEEVRDRIYATATVLDDGTTRLCLLAANLLSSTTHWSDILRARVGELLGIPAEQVMFHVHQNHATPSLGHLFTFEKESSEPMDAWPWLLGGDEAYHPWCVDQLCTAAEQALADLSPVTLEAGRGMDGRVAFNRRFLLRDGSAITHAQCDRDQILACEGPMDPEVGVWRFLDGEGKTKAMTLHHSCHPCHGFPGRYVIADWTGQWEVEMMEGGEAQTALTLNGCCGNLHHCDHLSPAPMHDYRRMAEMLAETTRKTLESDMHGLDAVPLKSPSRTLQIPWRHLTEEETAEAQAKLDAFPEPEWEEEGEKVAWDWVYAVGRLDLAKMQRAYAFKPYEIQVFRIGDAAIVGLKGEPFVEAQLEIKLKSPAPYTTVAHFCNGYAGYLPTRKAFEGGGYETRTGSGSHHCEEALEMVTSASIQMLNELFA